MWVPRNKHQRQRGARQLKRVKGKRPPYPRVLIVCEGSKTEPLYFNDIRILNRVPSVYVKVLPADGTEPLQIVDHAMSTFDNDGRTYENIFAVFDRDDHRTYHNALARAAALDGKLRNDERQIVRFVAVPSVPCFELWLLLHFKEIHALLDRAVVYRQLQGHIADYAKGLKGIYAVTEPSLPLAIERAKSLQARFTANGEDPYTLADEVVELLRSIRPIRT